MEVPFEGKEHNPLAQYSFSQKQIKNRIKVVEAEEYVMNKEPHSLKCQSSTEETHFRNKPLPILCYADAES